MHSRSIRSDNFVAAKQPLTIFPFDSSMAVVRNLVAAIVSRAASWPASPTRSFARISCDVLQINKGRSIRHSIGSLCQGWIKAESGVSGLGGRTSSRRAKPLDVQTAIGRNFGYPLRAFREEIKILAANDQCYIVIITVHLGNGRSAHRDRTGTSSHDHRAGHRRFSSEHRALFGYPPYANGLDYLEHRRSCHRPQQIFEQVT